MRQSSNEKQTAKFSSLKTDKDRQGAALDSAMMGTPASEEDSIRVNQMDRSAISASSAFNVEQKMQELKKKKDTYLSTQGRQAYKAVQPFNDAVEPG